jgi:hypothetical protein
MNDSMPPVKRIFGRNSHGVRPTNNTKKQRLIWLIGWLIGWLEGIINYHLKDEEEQSFVISLDIKNNQYHVARRFELVWRWNGWNPTVVEGQARPGQAGTMPYYTQSQGHACDNTIRYDTIRYDTNRTGHDRGKMSWHSNLLSTDRLTDSIDSIDFDPGATYAATQLKTGMFDVLYVAFYSFDDPPRNYMQAGRQAGRQAFI